MLVVKKGKTKWVAEVVYVKTLPQYPTKSMTTPLS
jgi:hypothetical protein